MAPSREQVVDVGGRTLRLTNLDKVLYPSTGFTKAEVVDYYVRVAPVLVPHLAHRPLTLKRYPNGVEGEHFYEKQCPSHRPGWMPTLDVPSSRRGHIRYCTVDGVAPLVFLANAANLELHPLLFRAGDPEHPTHVVFDLDPGPPAAWAEVIEVALLLRELLEADAHQPVVASSGSKGLHVSVPLEGTVGFDQAKDYARRTAQVVASSRPDLVVTNMAKSLRTGKVLVDWSQNDRHKSTVSVYSLRARPEPVVATPLRWDEVEALAGDPRPDPARLLFAPAVVLERVERHGDLAAGLLAPGRRPRSAEPEVVPPDRVRVVLPGDRARGPGRRPPPDDLRPMLATPGPLPEDGGWAHEVRWRGERVLATVVATTVSVVDASGKAIGDRLPEIQAMGRALGAREVVLDGVVVAVDDTGAPRGDAAPVRRRLAGAAGPRTAGRLALMVVDLLWLEGRSCLELPWHERRRLLDDLDLAGPAWQTPSATTAPASDLLRAVAAQGFPGLVAKRTDSPYRPGEASADWVEVAAPRRPDRVVSPPTPRG